MWLSRTAKPQAASFVMAAVQVAQLAPAFMGDQSTYGPTYCGGLAPPPQRWLQFVGVVPPCQLAPIQQDNVQSWAQPWPMTLPAPCFPTTFMPTHAFSAWTPPPPSMPAPAFNPVPLTSSPATFPSYLPGFVASAATTARMHLPELACRHRF